MQNKEKTMRELVHELDASFGALLSNVESIKAIRTELGHIRVDVDDTDLTDRTSMAIRFRDIQHKIVLLDDLLHYVTEDVLSNYEKGYDIKGELFRKVVRESAAGAME